MRSFLSFCFALLLFLPNVAFAQNDTLRIVYPDFYPFFSRNSDGEMTGVFYEIVKEALEIRLQQNVEWQMFPWKRCQSMVESGDADAMITTITPERLQYASTHSHPLFVRTVNVFTYPSHPKMESIQSIRNFEDIHKSDLSIITYVGNGWVKKNAKTYKIRTQQTPVRENIWQMLAHKRGDIVIEWDAVAWPEIHKYNLDHMIMQSKAVIQSVPFHLMVSKKSSYTGLLPKFDKEIQKMQKQGAILTITKKYITSAKKK